ncbi:MAG: hypothetical protein JW913_13240, partial [Chitinispirillaceae bacterium]|nr:hypothetical protein [Chitinispirillaceae bacterium]
GVVFVADSAQDKIEENLESFQNLEDNLAEYGYKRENIPIIMQYNKRDLPNALPVEQLEQYINKYHLPWSEAVANKGVGVFDSLKLIGKIVIDYLNKKYSRGSRPAGAPPQQQVPQFQSRQPGKQAPGQQHSSPMYNQLGQPPQQPGRPQFQGAAGQPQQRPGYPQPLRQPSLPPAQMPINRSGGPRQPQQQPMRQSQGYMPQQQYQQNVPPPEPRYQPMQQQHAPNPGARPAMHHPGPAEEYQDQITFEPAAPGSQAPQQGAPAQEEYYSYGSINLEPMDTQNQSEMTAPQEQYAVFDQPQQSVPRQGYDSTGGKTDLDLEIERYQREIEEKQHRTRASGPTAATQLPYTPTPQQSAQQRPADNQGNAQQEYEVYNMEAPAYGAQQQQPVQPIIGSNEEEEMFFTSVDTDRQKKPVKRPVNPRTQQQKGFLSKFFNKEMP